MLDGKILGDWLALHVIGEKDGNGNVIKGDVIIKDTNNTYINTDHRMVVTVGVDNLIIVDTPDVTLIASQDKAQEVKSIVESLQDSGRSESMHIAKFIVLGVGTTLLNQVSTSK